MLFADKFKKNEYPTPDMARILKATSVVGAKALKTSSSAAKEVRSSLECLDEDSIGKGAEEEAFPKVEKGKEAKGKEKAPDEPQKKRKLIHINSSSRKFGTTVSHSSKGVVPPSKLMESAMKGVKVEMVRKAEEEEALEEAAQEVAEKEEEAVEVLKRPRPTRTSGKSVSFLEERQEELALPCWRPCHLKSEVPQQTSTVSGRTDGKLIPPPAMSLTLPRPW